MNSLDFKPLIQAQFIPACLSWLDFSKKDLADSSLVILFINSWPIHVWFCFTLPPCKLLVAWRWLIWLSQVAWWYNCLAYLCSAFPSCTSHFSWSSPSYSVALLLWTLNDIEWWGHFGLPDPRIPLYIVMLGTSMAEAAWADSPEHIDFRLQTKQCLVQPLLLLPYYYHCRTVFTFSLSVFSQVFGLSS